MQEGSIRKLGRALALVALTALGCSAKTSEPIRMQIDVDSVKREAWVYLPRNPVGQTVKHPVILGFHGHGATAKSADKWMRLQDYWPGAIVVYMQGLPTPGISYDFEGKLAGWQHLPGQEGDRDIQFFDEMLVALHRKFSIDDKRIYVVGFSNGAYFSYLLWAERASKIAALGICAGRLVDDVRLSTPRSLIAIVGRRDHVVKFEQQMKSIEVAKRLADAQDQGASCGPGCTSYQGNDGVSVATLITDEGHGYPTYASPQVVKFFEAHALR